jgi:hypothetical protein
VTTPDTRPAATSTFVLEQPVDTVWDTLIGPAAMMWLLPKAIYSIVAPEPRGDGGELRGVWVDRVRKGIRLSSVWELIRDEPGRRVTFLDRSRPDRPLSLGFQLSSIDGGTQVRVDVAHGYPWWSTPIIGRLNQRSLQGVQERLRLATGGDAVEPLNGQSMTMAPGTGAKKQTNAIVISAAPRRVWKIVNDKDATLLPAPDRLASWRREIDGVEFIFTFDGDPSGRVVCSVARVLVDGPYRVTTVDATGLEILHELLPKDADCLLRATHRWTALRRSKDLRKDAEHWLQQVKEIAESG